MNRLILLLSFLNLTGFSQTDFLAETYRYFPGTGEPESNWAHTDYDDALWRTGSGAIGFGDVTYQPFYTIPSFTSFLQQGDTLIKTITDQVPCIYVRYTFLITEEDTARIHGMSLDVYFDDGFIAYLNGVEFARCNMGKKGSSSSYNTLTTRSHEAPVAAGDLYPVPGYFMNRNFLKNNLIIGENIIGVEVHNDSLNGSDLFLKCCLFETLHNTIYDPLMSFWETTITWQNGMGMRVKSYIEPDSSILPIFIIETDEYGIPFRKIEVPAEMKVIAKGNGLYNKPDDDVFHYNGRIKIERRGNSSAYYPKMSFNIETQTASGDNNNVSLLGLPQENDWILSGPISDKSMIQNVFIYELGRKQGQWQPRSMFCELILNGEYMGLYILHEKIKPDKNRLNISRLKEEDVSGYEVTGGYIFWKYMNSFNIIQYPSENKIQPEQQEYINSFAERYYNLLFSGKWMDPDSGYRSVVDVGSMLDYLIINELAYDVDKYEQSTFAYKDRDDKDPLIRFGPLWDYDNSLGSCRYVKESDQWSLRSGIFSRYMQDTSLVREFAERWFEQRAEYLNSEFMFTLIDSLVDHISEPLKRDSMVWEAYDKINLYFAEYDTFEYPAIIQKLKDWIQERLEWIDNNIENIYFPLISYSEISVNENMQYPLKAYPVPFSDQLTIDFIPSDVGYYEIDISSIYGNLIKSFKVRGVPGENISVKWHVPENIPPGIYVISIRLKNQNLGFIKAMRTF